MAVYTKLSRGDIEQFLTRYEIGRLVSAQGIVEGIDNTNYVVTANRGGGDKRYILTLFERRIAAHDVSFFMAFIEWLAGRGILCPKPVADKNGAVIQTLKGRPASLVQFLEGRNNPAITPLHLTLVGKLAARMHLAAEGFLQLRRNTLSHAGWRDIFCGIRRQADNISAGLEKELEEELGYLEKNWPHGLPAGIIHADLFPDNIFFLRGASGDPHLSGVIDFYFSCHDFWMYDLAIVLNAWCFDAQHVFVPERAKELFSAYDHLRPITAAEKEALPILARGAAMRFLVTRAHDWLSRVRGVLVTPKDPMEYVTKLRFFREKGVTGLLDDWIAR